MCVFLVVVVCGIVSETYSTLCSNRSANRKADRTVFKEGAKEQCVLSNLGSRWLMFLGRSALTAVQTILSK